MSSEFSISCSSSHGRHKKPSPDLIGENVDAAHGWSLVARIKDTRLTWGKMTGICTLSSSGPPIAQQPLKFAVQGAEATGVQREKGSAMEVDRVSQMGGVGRDGVPAWPKGQIRRRKFVEEIAEPEDEAAEDGSDEEASMESNENDGRTLDLMV